MTKKVLLIEKNIEIESMYALNLRTYVGLEVESKRKAEYALKLLETESFDLVVTRMKIDNENSAEMIIEYLIENNLETPVITLGECETEYPENIVNFPNGVDLKGVVKQAAASLDITAKMMSEVVVPNYFPIPIHYFNVLKYCVCNIYGPDYDSPGQYIELLSASSTLNSNIIKDYVAQGIPELFVKREDRLKFVNSVTAEMIALLDDGSLSKEDLVKTSEVNMDLTSERLQVLGVTPETVELAKKSIKMIQANIKGSGSKLGKLFKNLLSNKSSYRFMHTQLATFLCFHMMEHLDWGTDEQKEKLAFIAFFHDIVLTKDEMAMIHSKQELRSSNLSPEEKSLVEKHAMIAAELVGQIPKAPMGVDVIIRQHHGILNGNGFADHFSANISPATIVFIIAEEYSKIVLSSESEQINQADVCTKLKAKFPTARFSKILEILEKVTI